MAQTNEPYILNKKFTITSADADFSGNLKISALTNFFIQAAWQHAEQLGWGVDELAKHNLAWVLSSMRIKINSYPEWRDTVLCETWPKGMERLFYLRDFIIYNKDNNIVASATSNWMLIDISRRRPKLFKLDDKAITHNKDKHAIDEKIAPVNFDKEVEQENLYKIKYSDIDINKHLTTTRYIDLIFDSYSPDEMKFKRPIDITLNFTKEITFGESVRIFRSTQENNKVKFQMISPGEKVSFKADINFAP